jgi:molecular chaperone DnaK
MRETIDFGIDLGTTNSAIAVAEGSTARILKANDDRDTTPSVVSMPTKGQIRVGSRAKNTLAEGSENAHGEFKLEMGVQGAGRAFRSAGLRLSPEELSAEVLKSLRQDAAHALGGGQPPTAAVITVPAAFSLNQNNATTRAAGLAGLSEECPLVHEPTAAAIAFGVQDTSGSAHWMVFDLGGGTFDAAVMQKREGELQLIQHAGNHCLGGKDIDWDIVEQLLAPAFARELGLHDFVRGNPKWRGHFGKLKAAAEEAKIELSRSASTTVDVEFSDGRCGYQSVSYTLTRGAVEDLAMPHYRQAVKLCRQALVESSLRPEHIDRLLLVGGSTLAPGLRELLDDPQDGLGIPLDYSQDPTTVVARGAALFASSVRLPQNLPKARPGEFTMRLHYEPRVLDATDIPVAGTLGTGGSADWTNYSITLSNPAGHPPYQGPRISLGGNGTFSTTVSIDSGADATSRFSVELLDGSGVRQRLTPDAFSITHASLIPPHEALTDTLGIGRADGTFAAILRKGTAVPAVETQVYRTNIPLSSSQPEAVIRIPLLEGKRTKAKHNKQVGELRFGRRDVPIDLPRGSEVEVTMEVVRAGQVVVTAELPVTRQQFKVEAKLIVPEPDQSDLQDQLHDVRARVDQLTMQATAAGAEEAQTLLRELAEEGQLGKAAKLVDASAVDGSAALSSQQLLHELEANCDEAEEAISVPVLVSEVWANLAQCEDMLGQHAKAAEQNELDDLRNRARKVVEDADPTTLRQLLERIDDLRVEILRSTGELDLLVFPALVDLRDEMTSRSKADSLISQGKQAIAAGDRDGLSQVIVRLRNLLPPGFGQAIVPGGVL